MEFRRVLFRSAAAPAEAQGPSKALATPPSPASRGRPPTGARPPHRLASRGFLRPEPLACPPRLFPPEPGRRRPFAIISHPDAGKTTLTEKLLLFSGALHIAGAVKGRKASRHATSD